MGKDIDIFEELKTVLPDDKMFQDLSEVFKVFSDSTRIKILWALFDTELSVGEICDKISMSPSAVSHQLRTLKQARLVKFRRDGKQTIYSLDDEHVKTIIEQVLIHINE